MIDHERDLASVDEATEQLLASAAGLDNAAVHEPSRLPGWSRGHVLAHLARNADALCNVFEGRPMYETAEVRDADIERDAPRPLSEQLEDVRASAARLRERAALPADWSRTVTLRNGVTDTAARIPFRRRVEIELHHVDLGIGYELEDLSAEFTAREIDFLQQRFSSDPAVAEVTGPATALLGWLSGRRDGAGLTAPGATLPVLPSL
ncbi:maleylpyruvate isomerase family mycothiol-dependent enzyme [Streptomyces sp. NBC_01267]|uniref:maleylpyruvate isomerase family mycothiol-dependent enzyme n=1 Tax=unclassified Streptomyces TaxID=2593676 RepID=UPI00224C8B97|nr:MULTISPECIES: maleylpyruvate isomerase family mycothiol-dependent enzyme [unclassified Streptomyces]MCX4551779.1 maleylpyruvate isomerase family mycothiol-dependent enzyme [Streptomyces sp. NBC_01500]